MSRTHLVTGSASGVGAAVAQALRARGDRVVGIDLRDADITADLGTPEGRAGAVESAVAATGGTVDSVIACAGISAPKPLTVAVNYFGVVDVLTGLLPALRRSTAPRAAVVSSMATLQRNSPDLVDACLAHDEERALTIAAGLAEQGPGVGYLAYPSSKRALSRWVRRESITADWAGAGIALNAVAPATILTPMTRELLAAPESVAMVDKAVPMPLNYHQSPESVAELLVWLTSEVNTHVTGQTIYCDGGADASLRGDDVWGWADPA
ncbi:SDR family oxidoreductase [Cellulomonas fengjieae]|uniref:SDR family oxidoreductase n=1 Tax=Cellulomonas fengjieae TaxID=2819978 RepID=A0ABS3SDC9_9CELL|nr:SDR family oxidoreductase [Cellulomonas fengjieae]MBO3083745.1 SDR family oxidoreductase [Cellulomonas fengjieae]QVI64956.1 SDR family oxidoreductase [Cellulomonas fengjieae]